MKFFRCIIICCLCFLVSCINSEKKQEFKNTVFKDFNKLVADSINYFDIEIKDSGMLMYKFTTAKDEKTPFISNIGFGSGEIYRKHNVIYLSPMYQDSSLNIKKMELFNFDLPIRKQKQCSFISKDKYYYYDILLRGTTVINKDSLYWFQIRNNKIISNCEIANFIISSNKGITSVFESQFSDTLIVNAFNIIGNIPATFKDSIRVMRPF